MCVGLVLIISMAGRTQTGEAVDGEGTRGIDSPFTTGRQTTRSKGKTVEWAVVKSNSVSVFGIPADAGGLTRYERARIIAEDRLGRLFGKVHLSDRASYAIRTVNNELAICVRNPNGYGGLPKTVILLTIDRNFERVLNAKRTDIARFWRDLLVKNVIGRSRDGLDPDGRPLKDEETWTDIPTGYSQRHPE